MAKYPRLRWLVLRRTASRWAPGFIPAHMARSVPKCTPGLVAHQLLTSIPANTTHPVPRYTLVLATPQLQTNIPDNTMHSVPKCTPVLAAPQLQTNMSDNTMRAIPDCTLVLAAPQLQTNIPDNMMRVGPECTLVLAAPELQTGIGASTSLGQGGHRLQISIPVGTGRLVGRCIPAPASLRRQTVTPANHNGTEVQWVPISPVAVSIRRDCKPVCRRHLRRRSRWC
jgi:hypothetical protein